MKFKKRRGICLSYNKQGLIYFTCMTIDSQPPSVKAKITNMCMAIAGNDYKALYELLTNDRLNVTAISGRFYISEKRLYQYRKQFYENWDKYIPHTNF